MFEHFDKKQPEDEQPMDFFRGLFDAGKHVVKSWQLASREDAYQMQGFAMKSDEAMEEAYADVI